jgi:hypothetical protein
MSTSDSSLPPHWQFYAERAHQTQNGRVDDLGNGTEELLWEILAMIESAIPFNDDSRQRLGRLPWNRAKKYRRLRLSLCARHSTGREAVGPGRPLGRGWIGTARAAECNPGKPGGADTTCRTCGQAMILAEHIAYGSRCEDCWAVEVVELEVDDSVTQVQGISVDQVQSMLSPAEWEVECRLAAGQTYADVARGRNVSPDALKVRAGRWRARIRLRLAPIPRPGARSDRAECPCRRSTGRAGSGEPRSAGR